MCLGNFVKNLLTQMYRFISRLSITGFLFTPHILQIPRRVWLLILSLDEEYTIEIDFH